MNINHNNNDNKDNRLLKRTKSCLCDMHMLTVNTCEMRYGYRYTWVLTVYHVVAISRCRGVFETFVILDKQTARIRWFQKDFCK